MATKFPKFSQALAQDPTTRRIWYGIATAHDFETHDGMTEEKSLPKRFFASHFWTFYQLFFLLDLRQSISCCLAGKFLSNGYSTH